MIDTLKERKEEGTKLQFHLTGFTQNAGTRVYAFEGRINTQRTAYTVAVDMGLIPGYGIRIQELPLLCRECLQQVEQPETLSAFVFTEQLMRSHAERLTLAREAAELKRKMPKRHAASSAGR